MAKIYKLWLHLEEQDYDYEDDARKLDAEYEPLDLGPYNTAEEADRVRNEIYDNYTDPPRRFIVIETFGGPEHSVICTEEDGTVKVFHTREEAEAEAAECQEGIVVPI